MKKIIVISILTIFISSRLYAQNLRNSSISFDPFSLLGTILFFASLPNENEEPRQIDFNNIWLGIDANWETKTQKEMGLGIFLGTHKIALRTQYRSFYNKEKQSGFFWGLYGLIEWRKMFWMYDNDNELTVGWGYPFIESDNVYYSLGIAGGGNVGFRFRKNNFGITPYIGLGMPLFYCFGSFPPKHDMKEFDFMNIIFRAIDVGIKLDFFNDK